MFNRSVQLTEIVDQMLGIVSQIEEVQPGEIEMDDPVELISNFYRYFNDIARLPKYSNTNSLLDLFKQPLIFYSAMLLHHENLVDETEKKKLMELLSTIKVIIQKQCHRILFKDHEISIDKKRALCPEFEAYLMANCDEKILMNILFSHGRTPLIPSDAGKRMLARKKCRDATETDFNYFYSAYKNENIFETLGQIYQAIDLDSSSNIFTRGRYLHADEKNKIIEAILIKADRIILSVSGDQSKVNDLNNLLKTANNVIPLIENEIIFTNIKEISRTWKKIRDSMADDIINATETNDTSFLKKVACLREVLKLNSRVAIHKAQILFPLNNLTTSRHEVMDAWLSRNNKLLEDACTQCLDGDITDCRADYNNYLSFLTMLKSLNDFHFPSELLANTLVVMIGDVISKNSEWRNIDTRFSNHDQKMVKDACEEYKKLIFPRQLIKAKLALSEFILSRISECLMGRRDLNIEIIEIKKQVDLHERLINIFNNNVLSGEPVKNINELNYRLNYFPFASIEKSYQSLEYIITERLSDYHTALSTRPQNERKDLHARLRTFLADQLEFTPVDESFVNTAESVLSNIIERLDFLDRITNHNDSFILSDKIREVFIDKHIKSITFPLSTAEEFKNTAQRDCNRLLSIGRMNYLITGYIRSNTNNGFNTDIKTISLIWAQVSAISIVFGNDMKTDERARQLVSMLADLPAVKRLSDQRKNSRFFEKNIPPEDFIFYRLYQLAASIVDPTNIKNESTQEGIRMGSSK